MNFKLWNLEGEMQRTGLKLCIAKGRFWGMEPLDGN